MLNVKTKITQVVNRFVVWWKDIFRNRGCVGKTILVCLSILAIVCLFSVPIVIFSPEKQAPKLEPTNTPISLIAESEETSRCVPASDLQMSGIQDGIDDILQNGYIKTAWAVKSDTFVESVWMVAAKIYGPGIMENGVGPRVWAISGDIDSPKLFLSVNGFAKEFSPFPDASKTDAIITITDDGISEAIECAENE